ncbi:MAG: cytochrome c oxidase subunit 3 [Candidatus Poribacteria bacterium]|nr:cytochrome c oxidase subunit 3 [Candidatus Poribacteria bacterium]
MEDTATLDHSADVYEPSLTPDSLGKLGMWLFLISDAMSFGALLAAYGAIRAGAAEWAPPSEVLGIELTAFMTFLLICSSVTMVKALEAIQNGNQRRMCTFLGLTILGGVIFLGLQAYEWTHLIKHGLTLTTIPHHGLSGAEISGSVLFGPTFYTITGFHGAHVTGGVIYLIVILIQGLRGNYTAEYNHKVEILGLYWHFVDLIWIMVFTFVYLL